jgi:hypothetical protein
MAANAACAMTGCPDRAAARVGVLVRVVPADPEQLP